MSHSRDLGHEIYNDYARTLIRLKARRLARRADFSRSDEDDISQELTLHLLNQADRFDPARSAVNTFISVVIDSGIRMLLRKHGSSRRMPESGEIQTLETMVDLPDAPPAPLEALISQDDLERRTGNETKPESAVQEEQETFEHAISSLPADLQPLCRQLMVDSPTAAAAKLRITRHKLRDSMQLIREHLASFGLACG